MGRETKTCTDCGFEKLLIDFVKASKNKDGRDHVCRVCGRIRQKVYRERNKYAVAAAKRKYNYGITDNEYQHLFTKQKGRCIICKKEKLLGVEHDHETKKIRGLACRRCNSAIGFIDESVEIAESIVSYLKEHKKCLLLVA